MSKGKFGTAINCMDGRAQLPVINWMKQHYHLDYVDMVTDPGPDRILAEKTKGLESIKARILISLKAHGSDLIIVASHHDCAGNPVEKEEHCSQVRQAIQTIRSWNLPAKKVAGIWVNESWNVEPIEL